MDTIKKILQKHECPKCHGSWVDSEISEPMKKFCSPGAFHSKLYGAGAGKWSCPHCREVFEEELFE